MKALLPLALLATPALAYQGYPKAVPDVARLTCAFRAVSDPAIPARKIEIRQTDDDFAWIEEGQSALPILAAMRMQTKAVGGEALTSFMAPVTDGTMSMLTYAANGSAELTKHGTSGTYVTWTTQLGQCSEEKAN